MTDFFSTRFATEPDAPEPRASFVADLRRQLEAEWADDREALQMSITEQRPARQSTEPPLRTNRRYAFIAAAAAAIAVVIGMVVVGGGNDDTSVVNEPSSTTTTTAAPPAPESVGQVDLRTSTEGGPLPISVIGTPAGLWAMAGGDLERIDVTTGVRTTAVQVTDGTEDRVDDAIFPANDSLYIALSGIGIVEVSGDGTTIERRFDVPTIGAYRGIALAVSSDAMWAPVNGGDQLVRVDLASGAVSEPIEVAGGEEIRKLAFDGTSLYATTYRGVGKETLRRLDPVTLEEQDSVALPVYLTRGILLTDGTVWVSGDIDNRGVPSVSAIDTDTMTIRSTVSPEGLYGQRLVERDGIIWVGLHEADLVSGIDVETGEIVATLELPGPRTGADDLAVDPNGSLWLADPMRRELLRFAITR